MKWCRGVGNSVKFGNGPKETLSRSKSLRFFIHPYTSTYIAR